MKRLILLSLIMISIISILFIAGCDKEKIVESTEYIHDIEYITLPPDTITIHDTVFKNDTTVVNQVDTVKIYDTVVEVNNFYDTVYEVSYIYDTAILVDTVVEINNIYDTVIHTIEFYDTTIVVDTFQVDKFIPSVQMAYTALQAYSDPLVFDFIYAELGLNDGWVLYLSAYQSEVTTNSPTVYDIYGIIDYWAADWSGYYPLEYFWRMTYISGDPSDPNNWDLSEPPVGVSGYTPGLKMNNKPNDIKFIAR